MSDKLNDNWTTPQALALELEINASVVYGWIDNKQIVSKELGQGKNTGKKRYLVDKSTRPPLRGWDIKPTKEARPYYKAVLKLLELTPRRFDAENALN